MNLHSVVSGAIATVNPPTEVTVQQSTGYTVSADGTQVPVFTPVAADLQVHALGAHELEHLANLNIQGVMRKLYAYGSLNGVIRNAQEGGDLIQWNAMTWKVVHVFETWPDWSAVAIKQQVVGL